MKKIYTVKWVFVAIALIYVAQANAQVYTNKPVGKKNEALRDSIEKSDYPYVLPFMGAAATKRGFQLPYSAGMSMQMFTQVSDIIINNLNVGFNGGKMYNVDELIRFDKAQATATAITIRPDVWLFPFLNVYGILGMAQASTNIGYGLYVPDSNGNSINVFSGGTNVGFKTTTFGFGMTPTIGVAGCFLALDMNYAWTDVPQLSKPATSFVFGPRLGKSFRLKKESTMAFWAGGFRVHLNSETSGSIPLSDAMDLTGIQAKIDNANIKINNAQQGVDAWWTGLTPVEQKNPVNIAKHNAADAALEKAGAVVNGLGEAATHIGTSTVQYSMDKRPKDAWNFIIGTQYQYNRHWMIRVEYGFLSSRTQFMGGLQYRFGL